VTDLSTLDYVLAGVAAAVGAMINASAGGGTLVSFPTLTAIGVPALSANATNMVGMCPGYIAGTVAQRNDLAGLGPSLRSRVVCAAAGALVGAVLLVSTSERLFREIVPILVLASTALLAVQEPLRRWLARRRPSASGLAVVEMGCLFLACCYGGYFGAGLGIILLAVLGLFSALRFNQLNAIKQLLSIVVGVTSATFLAFTSHVEWALVACMVPGSLVGGALGGRLATRVDPGRLRAAVVVCGCVIALVYALT
jgi:uncharacterized membrane protein YfcA